MKLWPIFFLWASCQAVVPLIPKNPDDFGSVISFQNQDILGQYVNGYREGHPSGETFRRESGDAFGNKVGSYGIREADGRVRIVNYIADANGFRAEVTSNEPGVAPQNPASVTINKPPLLPVPAVPVPPVAPVAFPPPPPPPLQAAVAVPPKVFPPYPVSYNYIAPAPAPLAVPPPPPPAYFPPRYVTSVAPIARPLAPVAVAPVAKGLPAYPPPPPPAYYTNLVQGKGYLNAVRAYTNLFPPLSAVPPQYNYLSIKTPPPYQDIGFPL